MKTFTQTVSISNGTVTCIQTGNSVFYKDHFYIGLLSSYNDGAYFGILQFTESENWKEKIIQKITFSFSCPSTFLKKLNFYRCSQVNGLINTGKLGSTYLGNALGEAFSDTTSLTTITFSSTEYSDYFNAIVRYLKSEDNVQNICICDDGVSKENPKLTKINQITITIEYEEGGIVYYGTNEGWKPCLIYYGTSSGWQQVIPYYGTSNGWQPLSG